MGRASLPRRPRYLRSQKGSVRVQLASAEETHVLFGDLIARLEGIIREDEGLREGLAEQRRKLADARQYTEVSMRTVKVAPPPADVEEEAEAPQASKVKEVAVLYV